MGTSKTWPGGSANVTPASHTIPAGGELNWASLSDLLIALADGAQSTTFQKVAIRQAVSTPITVATTDCVVSIKLSVAGAVAVALPAGANKQYFYIYDEAGNAGTHTITITPDGSETIGGAGTTTLVTNNECVILAYVAASTDWKIIGRIRPNPLATVIGGLTVSRAVVSGSGGLLEAATTTSTEIGYVNGLSSAVQTQLDAKLPKAGGAMTGAITTNSTFDGRDVATDGTKLDGIEASADVTDTTNVTAAGALMDSELAGLAAVKATTGTFLTADQTKLDGIEASADVTDATNVNAAGAVMNSDASTASMSFVIDEDGMGTDTATKVPTQQSVKAYADTMLPLAGGTMAGILAMGANAITTSTTVDGRDVSADGTKLDGIETSADVTDTTNVTAAGALMDSELASIAAIKATTGTFLTADQTKLNGIETSADVTDATNVNAAGAVMNTDTSTSAMDFVIDEDGMGTDTATKVPTQQSVKAYVDAQVGATYTLDAYDSFYNAAATVSTSDNQTNVNLSGSSYVTVVTGSDTGNDIYEFICDYGVTLFVIEGSGGAYGGFGLTRASDTSFTADVASIWNNGQFALSNYGSTTYHPELMTKMGTLTELGLSASTTYYIRLVGLTHVDTGTSWTWGYDTSGTRGIGTRLTYRKWKKS